MELEKLSYEQIKSFSGKEFVDYIADNGFFTDLDDLLKYGHFIKVIYKVMDYETVFSNFGLEAVIKDKDCTPLNETVEALRSVGASEYAEILSELNEYLLSVNALDNLSENEHIMSVINEYEERLSNKKSEMDQTFFMLMYSYADKQLKSLK
ncbi:MAG: hypothetical protein IJ446_05955 [Oscillospiraceae bacterium]|nr:hypothetical protein [Oscillospiraceae bacterium]